MIDDAKTGWETVRDDDGNFVKVINHDARAETPDEMLEDIYDSWALDDSMDLYSDGDEL